MEQALTYLREKLSPLYPAYEVQAISRLLLENLFGCSAIDIYLGKDRRFSAKERQLMQDIVARMVQNEPIQYILGEADFGALSFCVEQGVLIPRSETTELVAWIVEDNLTSPTPRRILDIGTGSGCIAISLAKQLPTAQVVAWDNSPTALKVARANNLRHHTQVAVVSQDLFSAPPKDITFDIIVSNPPYVTWAERSTMAPNVSQWEPYEALFVPDDDALCYYERIAVVGKELLGAEGVIYMEINQAFGREVVQCFQRAGYRHVELRQDLSQHNRMVKAKR